MGRLIVLSGPSCAGKSPLLKALRRMHPELAEPLRPVVLYNSRPPRPGEQDGQDYHFRRRKHIEALREKEGFVVMEVRGDLQALDLGELSSMLADGDAMYEGNPFVGRKLLEASLPDGAERMSAFLSPLSGEEIRELSAPERNVDFDELLTDVMRRKLLRRTRKQKVILSREDLEEVERRASSAPRELRLARESRNVIVCHDGEDSENWDAFYWPLGEARLALRDFASLLSGQASDRIERWDENTVPAATR